MSNEAVWAIMAACVVIGALIALGLIIFSQKTEDDVLAEKTFRIAVVITVAVIVILIAVCVNIAQIVQYGDLFARHGL